MSIDMNMEQFAKLNARDRALVEEAFRDGYKASIDTVESYKVRSTPASEHDKIVNATAQQIADILKDILKNME
jgi:hypothetical protein